MISLKLKHVSVRIARYSQHEDTKLAALVMEMSLCKLLAEFLTGVVLYLLCDVMSLTSIPDVTFFPTTECRYQEDLRMLH